MRGLLRLLRDHEGAVEADLQRIYGIDYRDRWRGGLTLRRLHVLIRHLPPDSATAVALGGPSWSIGDHLLDDIRMALTHSKKRPAKPHPLRPRGRRKKTLDPRRLAAGRRRRAERRDAIERGDIT